MHTAESQSCCNSQSGLVHYQSPTNRREATHMNYFTATLPLGSTCLLSAKPPLLLSCHFTVLKQACFLWHLCRLRARGLPRWVRLHTTSESIRESRLARSKTRIRSRKTRRQQGQRQLCHCWYLPCSGAPRTRARKHRVADARCFLTVSRALLGSGRRAKRRRACSAVSTSDGAWEARKATTAAATGGHLSRSTP